MKTELLFILLVVYQLKHFLADYPLQTDFMLGKFGRGLTWIAPLGAHVSVHGAMTFLIALVVSGDLSLAWWLATFDTGVHFTMDRIKASPNMMGRWKALSAKEHQNYTRLAGVSPHGCSPEYLADQATSRRLLRGNRYFWWALGFDQAVHHLTHYAIIYALVS